MQVPRKSSRSGHAMLELTVAGALLLGVLGVVFQFGYTFYVYNRLVTAMGNGGRYAAQRTYRGSMAENEKAAERAIRNMVVYGAPRPGPESEPLVPYLKPEQIEVQWDGPQGEAPNMVSLAVRNYTVDAVFRSYTFDRRPAISFPFVGRYAPEEKEP